eukprot:g7843.t1
MMLLSVRVAGAVGRMMAVEGPHYAHRPLRAMATVENHTLDSLVQEAQALANYTTLTVCEAFVKNLSFHIRPEALPALFTAAEQAGKELKDKRAEFADKRTCKLQPGSKLSKLHMVPEVLGLFGNVKTSDGVWGPPDPRTTCLSTELRKPLEQKGGFPMRVANGRVLPDEKHVWKRGQPSDVHALPYQTPYKPSAQALAVLADLGMPYASSMGPNLVLCGADADKLELQPYGVDRVNLIYRNDEEARKLLTAVVGFRWKHAIALLDVLASSLETFLSASVSGVFPSRMQDTKEKLDAEMSKNTPLGTQQDFVQTLYMLRAVHHYATKLYEQRRGSESAGAVLAAQGWQWRSFFQTWTNSADQVSQSPASIPEFSICTPHFQCFLYPTGDREQMRSNLMNAFASYNGNMKWRLISDKWKKQNITQLKWAPEDFLRSYEVLVKQQREIMCKVYGNDGVGKFADADEFLRLLQTRANKGKSAI